jgi:pyrroloquinoline quinone biosynthesis protein D
VTVDASRVPRLAPGVRLQRDAARDRWIVQAPERVLVPEQTALAVLQRCDGTATVAAIVDDLARAYDAPRAVIEADVVELLNDLFMKQVLVDGRS